MHIKTIIFLIVMSFASSILTAQTRPNVILVFCDDLGYGDLGCYGSTLHETPNIDQLAHEGIRFTEFYAAASVCTPSRAALLTGCYPQRLDMQASEKPVPHFRAVLQPGSPKGLNPDETTLADVFKQQEYATACIGKWHLGDQPEFMPRHYGFDYFFGIPYSHNMTSRKCPLGWLENGEVLQDVPFMDSEITDRVTDHAIEFIQRNAAEPFFLYLAHPMPHFPLDASEEFKGSSKDGIYGDAIAELDAAMGRLIDSIESMNLTEKTLVIFTSDNGGEGRAGPVKGGLNYPLRGDKSTTWEGGMRVPCIVRWPGTTPEHTESSELLTCLDMLPTLTRLVDSLLPDRKIDGINCDDALFQGHASPRTTLFYFEREQLQAVRWKQWKLHLPIEDKYERAVTSKTHAFSEPELYDLEYDPTESWNIAADHPRVVERMLQMADSIRQELGDTHLPAAEQRDAGWVDDPSCLFSPSSD